MGCKVIRLHDEPIVLVSVFGRFTLHDQDRLFETVATLGETFTGKLYRIVDATRRQSTFEGMMALTAEELKGRPGSVSDPRIVTLAVLSHANTLMAVRISTYTLGEQRRIFVFQSVSEAITAARKMIAGEVGDGRHPVWWSL